jgi:hypothetical protein
MNWQNRIYESLIELTEEKRSNLSSAEKKATKGLGGSHKDDYLAAEIIKKMRAKKRAARRTAAFQSKRAIGDRPFTTRQAGK